MTVHAKKAAEEATKSVQEASKTATAVSKNTFEDLTYVGKSTLDDLTKSAKEVVTKKGLLRVKINIFLLIFCLSKHYFRLTHLISLLKEGKIQLAVIRQL